MKTELPIIKNNEPIRVDNILLDKLSYLISDRKLLYADNRGKTNLYIEEFINKYKTRDSKHLHTKLVNFFLDKKIKENEKNSKDTLDIINLDDLKELCEYHDLKLIVNENEIAVYPTKSESISEDIPCLKEFFYQEDENNKEKELEMNVNYFYTEIVFLLGYYK